MKQLISGSTNPEAYYPTTAGVAITTEPDTVALTVTDEAGSTITIADSPTWDTDHWDIVLASGEITSSYDYQRLKFLWVWTDASQQLTDTEFAVVVPFGAYYGTIPGVQRYYSESLITFSSTSKPITTLELQTMLVGKATVVDARLAAAGYSTPVSSTYAAAHDILDEIVQGLTACSVGYRMVGSRDARGSRVAAYDEWKGDAEAMLALIESGKLQLPGLTKAGSNSGSTGASASSHTAAFSNDSSDSFRDDYEAPDGGYAP